MSRQPASLIQCRPPDTHSLAFNSYPEDCQYDVTRKMFYQSNLWKGRIRVTDSTKNTGFNVLIPNVSSTGYGDQQLSGLSLNTRTGANRLYAVAKDKNAFNFGPNQSSTGPSSFHAFSLPVNANSNPVWSVNLNDVQNTFALTNGGKRPFGPVDSAYADGFLYVVFALGYPAIAKISEDGKVVSAWYAEASNNNQRPGFTGITYSPSAKKLIAYGGPRILTTFDLSSGDGLPHMNAVSVSGNYGSLTVSEKLVNVPSLDGSGIRLLGVKSPYIYSFNSVDNWATANYKQFTRKEFNNNTLLNVCEAGFDGQRQIYGVGGYLNEGPKGGRSTFPMYRVVS